MFRLKCHDFIAVFVEYRCLEGMTDLQMCWRRKSNCCWIVITPKAFCGETPEEKAFLHSSEI